MKVTAPTTIKVDEETFSVDQFSEQVQNLIFIRTEWQNELTQQRLDAAKSEAALKTLDFELETLIKAEVSQKKESKASDAETE